MMEESWDLLEGLNNLKDFNDKKYFSERLKEFITININNEGFANIFNHEL